MNTTKYPATVREAGEMAERLGMNLSEFLEVLGPIPRPPAGYTQHGASGKRWIGPEIVGPHWILTAVWTATTNETTIEVYTATHVGEKYTHLTPSQALAMAADFVELSEAIAAQAIGNDA
jgi:hypothetical protein